MIIILSPAKKMKESHDDFEVQGKPYFLKEAASLIEQLKEMNQAELKKVWNCSDALVKENQKRLDQFSLSDHLSLAVFTYVGLAYQHLASDVMTQEQLDYLQDHLRILSGLYGFLKPFDGICPYRLEMQAKLPTFDLYSFWNSKIYDALTKETDCIINLASKEYSLVIEKYLTEKVKYITIDFCEKKGDKLIQKGTMAKMARGDMVRWMSENNIEKVEDIQKFALHYHFDKESSDQNHYVFIKDENV